MAKLTPYIMSEDARAQAEFYVQALGGEILSVMTHGQLPDASEANKDKVMHLSMVAGGVGFFLCDFGFGTINHGNAVHCMKLGVAGVGIGKDQAVIQQGSIALLHPVQRGQQRGQPFHAVGAEFGGDGLIADALIHRLFMGGLVEGAGIARHIDGGGWFRESHVEDARLIGRQADGEQLGHDWRHLAKIGH